jgi:hypothetical protein
VNLEQIRDAILQSLYIGVIEALLRSKSNTQVFQQCYGKTLTLASAHKRLDHEVETWIEIQKTDYGWDLLNGVPIVTNPYSKYPHETLARPDVYKNSNPYLTNVIITIIEDEQLVPTCILFPKRQTQNETSVSWDEFHFKNALLGAVSEEGVSRLVTLQISERRDHYVRYGLAFMIEHGFMQS